jgi:titin
MRHLRFVVVPGLIAVLTAIVYGASPPAPSVQAVPANDNFANAINIPMPSKPGTVATADTTGATTEVGETTALSGCAPGGATPNTGSTAWYTWTAPNFSGGTIFDTYGSNFDTVIAVYTGNALGSLTLVSCNDDFGGSTRSSVVLQNSPAQTYRIQVGGFNGVQGNLVLNASVGAHMVVNSTADNNISDPVLTLREAMLLADVVPGGVGRALSAGEQAQIQTSGLGFAFGDLIHFNPSTFSQLSPATITLASALPNQSSDDTVISAIGAGVVVDGVTKAFDCFGVSVVGSGNVFEGMVVRRCNHGFSIAGDTTAITGNRVTENNVGVKLTGASATGNAVFFNFIGTDGITVQGNQIGVRIENGAATNTVGFTNVISGNDTGVLIIGSGSDGNTVMGNMIGTNLAGNVAIANTFDGIDVTNGAQNNVIGGDTAPERNIISGNGGDGVEMAGTGTTGNQVKGNYIGTNAAGNTPLWNTNGLVITQGAASNTAGGTAAGEGNVISGNVFHGIMIQDFNTHSNTVLGNLIGTSADGAFDVGNGVHGVTIVNSSDNNTIGGTVAAARNVISGNNLDGVNIDGAGTSDNRVWGNYIGTNEGGSAAIANLGEGVEISGGSSGNSVGGGSASQRNVISGNAVGVGISASAGNFVRMNYIGLNASGTTAIANTGSGVVLSGGASNNEIGGASAGNVIAGNGAMGVGIGGFSSGNVVAGNTIGLDAGGSTARPNGIHGVSIGEGSSDNVVGGDAAAERNVISANAFNGVSIDGVGTTGNVVSGNYIGTNSTGTADLGNGEDGVDIFSGATLNIVGGDTPGERNVVSGNGWGVTISAAMSNTVSGNYIGTNAAGTGALGNTNSGVLMFVGANENTLGGDGGERNVISGNGGHGVTIDFGSSLNTVRGNLIGTNAAGTAALGNGGSGVFMDNGASNNRIGDDADSGNVIANNANAGVLVDDATSDSNPIRINSIHSNGGPGIALIGGGNDALPAPAVADSSATSASGTGCPSCTIDVYGDAADEGRHYLGMVTASLGGSWTYSGPITGPNLTATATDGVGNTSQFSPAVAAEACDGADNDADTLVDEGYPNTDSDGRKDCVDFGQTCFDAAATLPCGIVDCSALAEDMDAFKDADGCPEPDNDNDGFPDPTDACPGTDAGTGVDGMFGAPQDLNHNGIRDGAEAAFTTDDVLTYQFEDRDGVLDTDGCHDSPGEDFDSDGYTDDVEAGVTLCANAVNDDNADDAVINDGCPGGPPMAGSFSEGQARIGTDAGYPCGGASWPSDLDTQLFSFNELDIFDLTSFLAPVRRLDSSPPSIKYGTRWDLRPGKEGFAQWINIQDLTALLGGVTGNPPMFSNTRAFGKVCPLAPGA